MLLLITLLHVGLGVVMGLSVDEAHYLLYARHLDWSYFDHPPLVGWVQWPLVALGAPVGLLRVLPALCWLLTAWGVYHLALRWARAADPDAGDAAAAGMWALLALALAPLLHVLAVGMLPDTLLMALLVGLLAQVWSLLDPRQVQRWPAWLRLGLLLGLAGLSKYTAAFALLPIAAVLLYQHGWALLRRPALWAALLLAAVCIAPVLAWNAANDWASFRYQLAHGKGSHWQVLELVRFVVLQVLLYGPLLWAALPGLWHSRRASAVPADGAAAVPLRKLPLWALGMVGVWPWLLLAYMAGGGSSLPHWTAPSWVVLAPVAGWALSRCTGWRRTLCSALVLVQLLWLLVLLGLTLSAGRPLLARSDAWPATPANPFADLYGWDSAGQHALQLAQQEGLTSVSVQNWTLASRIAWYGAPLPVHVLAPGQSQFDWWSTPLRSDEATLLLDWSHMAYEVPLRTTLPPGADAAAIAANSSEPGGFTSCRMLDEWTVRQAGLPLSRFRFWACKGWAGVPQPRLTPTGQ
ncbi:glycosyltransferase family 39 protein [Curvibacter sp. CHRR-16]|uniref:glycosyltransferase family 39 protein n=1 Tax=Curvibacter sp. CHRR-16 TaxID=2835872 RepID=UPI001BDA2E73|nr:glycosyltransferase family 39 protein [Curvibacter sp. CHRR-16]MBT0570498.1 glycosyltransferase family 39 protein [Curvibacter sp. CHRR-16]